MPQRVTNMSRVARSFRTAIGARKHDSVAVGIAQPQLVVLRIGVELLLDDTSANRATARRGSRVVVDLEPDEHNVPDRRAARILEVGMILLIPRVELQDELVAYIDSPISVVVIARRAPVGSLPPRICGNHRAEARTSHRKAADKMAEELPITGSMSDGPRKPS